MTCRDQFFLSTVKGPGMELESSGWQSEPLPPEVLLAHEHEILDTHLRPGERMGNQMVLIDLGL